MFFLVLYTIYLLIFLYVSFIIKKTEGGETLKDRLKQIRKNDPHGKTQDMFADFLGISKQNVSSYEMGRRNPSDAVIRLICEKCDVSEKWLRTGEGSMTIPKSKDEEISELLADIQKSGDGSFKHRLVSALAKLDEDGWDKLEELIDMISGK